MGDVQISRQQLRVLRSSTALEVTGPTVVSINVTPGGSHTVQGSTRQLTATATLSDSTTTNVTTSCAWTMADPIIATVGAATGLVTGVAPGTTFVTATYPGGITSTKQVNIDPLVVTSIVITPTGAHTSVGATTDFVATGTYSSGATGDVTDFCDWSVSNTAFGNIDDNGLFTGVAAGVINITAVHPDGPTATISTTVDPLSVTSIAVTPVGSHTNIGLTRPMTAIATWSDGSTSPVTLSCSWSSSATGVATVNSIGTLTAVSAGTATITAQYTGVVGGPSGAVTITVDPSTTAITSIAVSPATPSIPIGVTAQFTAIATYADSTTVDVSAIATWTSGTAITASISTLGVATGLAVGTTAIRATLGAIVSSPAILTVTQAVKVGSAYSGVTPRADIIATVQLSAADIRDPSLVDAFMTSLATRGVQGGFIIGRWADVHPAKVIKGSVANSAALPSSGNTVGDGWVVLNTGGAASTLNHLYVWQESWTSGSTTPLPHGTAPVSNGIGWIDKGQKNVWDLTDVWPTTAGTAGYNDSYVSTYLEAIETAKLNPDYPKKKIMLGFRGGDFTPDWVITQTGAVIGAAIPGGSKTVVSGGRWQVTPKFWNQVYIQAHNDVHQHLADVCDSFDVDVYMIKASNINGDTAEFRMQGGWYNIRTESFPLYAIANSGTASGDATYPLQGTITFDAPALSGSVRNALWSGTKGALLEISGVTGPTNWNDKLIKITGAESLAAGRYTYPMVTNVTAGTASAVAANLTGAHALNVTARRIGTNGLYESDWQLLWDQAGLGPSTTSVGTVTAASWVANVLTLTFSAAPATIVGNTVVISGAAPTSLNGTQLVTAVAGNTASFAITGSGTVTGSVQVVQGSTGYQKILDTWLATMDETTVNHPLQMTFHGAVWGRSGKGTALSFPAPTFLSIALIGGSNPYWGAWAESIGTGISRPSDFLATAAPPGNGWPNVLTAPRYNTLAPTRTALAIGRDRYGDRMVGQTNALPGTVAPYLNYRNAGNQVGGQMKEKDWGALIGMPVLPGNAPTGSAVKYGPADSGVFLAALNNIDKATVSGVVVPNASWIETFWITTYDPPGYKSQVEARLPTLAITGGPFSPTVRTPANTLMAPGGTQQLVLQYIDGTTGVDVTSDSRTIWVSDDPSVATVSATGLVTFIATSGSATIRGYYAGGDVAKFTVGVTAAVIVYRVFFKTLVTTTGVRVYESALPDISGYTAGWVNPQTTTVTPGTQSRQDRAPSWIGPGVSGYFRVVPVVGGLEDQSLAIVVAKRVPIAPGGLSWTWVKHGTADPVVALTWFTYDPDALTTHTALFVSGVFSSTVTKGVRSIEPPTVPLNAVRTFELAGVTAAAPGSGLAPTALPADWSIGLRVKVDVNTAPVQPATGLVGNINAARDAMDTSWIAPVPPVGAAWVADYYGSNDNGVTWIPLASNQPVSLTSYKWVQTFDAVTLYRFRVKIRYNTSVYDDAFFPVTFHLDEVGSPHTGQAQVDTDVAVAPITGLSTIFVLARIYDSTGLAQFGVFFKTAIDSTIRVMESMAPNQSGSTAGWGYAEDTATLAGVQASQIRAPSWAADGVTGYYLVVPVVAGVAVMSSAVEVACRIPVAPGGLGWKWNGWDATAGTAIIDLTWGSPDSDARSTHVYVPPAQPATAKGAGVVSGLHVPQGAYNQQFYATTAAVPGTGVAPTATGADWSNSSPAYVGVDTSNVHAVTGLTGGINSTKTAFVATWNLVRPPPDAQWVIDVYWSVDGGASWGGGLVADMPINAVTVTWNGTFSQGVTYALLIRVRWKGIAAGTVGPGRDYADAAVAAKVGLAAGSTVLVDPVVTMSYRLIPGVLWRGAEARLDVGSDPPSGYTNNFCYLGYGDKIAAACAGTVPTNVEVQMIRWSSGGYSGGVEWWPTVEGFKPATTAPTLSPAGWWHNPGNSWTAYYQALWASGLGWDWNKWLDGSFKGLLIRPPGGSTVASSFREFFGRTTAVPVNTQGSQGKIPGQMRLTF